MHVFPVMVDLAISLFLAPLAPGQKHRENKGISHCGSVKDCFLLDQETGSSMEYYLVSFFFRRQEDQKKFPPYSLVFLSRSQRWRIGSELGRGLG